MPKPASATVAPFRRGILALILCAAAATGGALAQAAPAAPRPTGPAQAAPRPAAPDPAFEAAQGAFQALPEGTRREVQDALAWTGHYASVVNGSFGRRTFDAILSYQRAGRTEANGILGDAARTALLAAGKRARDAAGFTVRTDEATGIAIGVPARLLPREQKAARGTRWQSRDGRVTLETRAFDPSEGDLQATFDRVSAATPERKVTYRLKRPDFLVVTGETPTGRFYIRYAATPGGVRGFTLGYDKALGAELDPVVIAVANSFDPAPAAVPSAPPAARAQAVAAVVPRAAPVPPAAPPARTVSGLMVSPGRVLTSAAALASCPSPRIGREPARLVVAEGEPGLALLEIADASSVPSLGIAPTPAPGADLFAIGVEPTGEATIVPGVAGPEARILAPLQPGAAGAPILDRAGRLAGILERYPVSPRLVAGIVPPTSYAVVPATAVAAFLTSNGIAAPGDRGAATAGERSAGEVAALIAGRVRRIACD